MKSKGTRDKATLHFSQERYYKDGPHGTVYCFLAIGDFEAMVKEKHAHCGRETLERRDKLAAAMRDAFNQHDALVAVAEAARTSIHSNNHTHRPGVMCPLCNDLLVALSAYERTKEAGRGS